MGLRPSSKALLHACQTQPEHPLESSQTRLAPALMKDKTGCRANFVVRAEALQELVTQVVQQLSRLLEFSHQFPPIQQRVIQLESHVCVRGWGTKRRPILTKEQACL